MSDVKINIKGCSKMSYPPGKVVYEADNLPVTACGVEFTDAELEKILVNYVTDLVFDSSGTDEIATLLGSIPTTSFEMDGLAKVLGAQAVMEDWRVGEALAESYLIAHRNCEFPWPTNRDLRNPSASPAGCDLVGFHQDKITAGNLDYKFAFGEIKTSTDPNYPPSVATGRSSGLQKQIEDLLGDTETKASLVRYMTLHAIGKPWYDKFKRSASRYFADRNDISLFGFIIRDVAQNVLDLKARSASMRKYHIAPVLIELRAIYLPISKISTLANRVNTIFGVTV